MGACSMQPVQGGICLLSRTSSCGSKKVGRRLCWARGASGQGLLQRAGAVPRVAFDQTLSPFASHARAPCCVRDCWEAWKNEEAILPGNPPDSPLSGEKKHRLMKNRGECTTHYKVG